MSTRTFADNFWVNSVWNQQYTNQIIPAMIIQQGENDVGLEVLVNKARTGKRACEQLLQLFKERAAIEEDYAKRITKLNKSFQPKDEIGTLKDVYETLKQEMDVSAKVHLDACTELKNKFEKPFYEFIEAQSQTRKQVCWSDHLLNNWLFH